MTDKQTEREYTSDENDSWNTYYAAILAAEKAYLESHQQTDETYRDTKEQEDESYKTTVIPAAEEFENEYCRLLGRFYDAIEQANLGYGVDATFFEGGATSVDVQVYFVAGTPILLADGSAKPIEQIQLGDIVYARTHDNPTDDLLKCKVVRTFTNRKGTWSLTAENISTQKQITVRGTAEHPFYVQDKGWTLLGELAIGDKLASASGETLTVVAKEHHPETVEVYNFEVEQAHTYFVGEAERQSLLVHNRCPDCGSWDRWHWLTLCKAEPVGSGPQFEAAKKYGAVSGQLHGELTQQTMGQTVNRLPNAEQALQIAEELGTSMPGMSQAKNALVVTDSDYSLGKRALAGGSLVLDTLGAATAGPRGGLVSNYGSAFQAKRVVNTSNVSQAAKDINKGLELSLPKQQIDKITNTTPAPFGQQSRPNIDFDWKPDSDSINYILRKGEITYENNVKTALDELRAANVLKEHGYDSKFLERLSDKGIKGQTPDLFVHRLGRVDVYTPENLNATTISRMIEKKSSQTNTVLVNLENLTDSQKFPLLMHETIARVRGKPKCDNMSIIFSYDGQLYWFMKDNN